MAKTLSKLLFGFVILLILLIAAAVYFISSVDPNTFKPKIQEIAKDQVGADLQIESIAWQFWPNIGLELTGVKLGVDADNPYEKFEGHGELLQVGQARVSVAAWPLLQSKIQVNEVLLQAPKIWFHQTADGVHNWQPILDVVAKASDPTAAEQPQEESTETALDVSVDQVKIAAAQVMVSGANEATINPLDVTLMNLSLDAPVDLELKAKVAALNTVLDLDLSSRFLLQGDVLTIQRLQTNLQGSEADQKLNLTSSATLNLTTMASEADVKFAPINMDAWMAFLDSMPSTEKPDDQAIAKAAPTEPTEIPVQMLKDLDVKLGLTLEEVMYKGAPHKLSALLNAQKGQVELRDLALNAYDGAAKGSITLDVTQAKPSLKGVLGLENMMLESVSKTWLGLTPVTGAFSSTFDVNATGDTVEEMIESLKGQSSLALAQARLPQLNLHQMVWSSLQSKQSGLMKTLDAMPELKEQLGTLKTPKILREPNQLNDFLASIQITPEQVSTDSIKASLNDQPIEAKLLYGRIKQNVQFQTALRMPFNDDDLQKISWPISCTGFLTAQSITDMFKCRLDTGEVKPLLKSLVKDRLKDKVKQKADEKLDPIKEKAKQDLKETEDKLKDDLDRKVQEKIGTSLKDLLGR